MSSGSYTLTSEHSEKQTNGGKVDFICEAQVDLRLQDPSATALLLLVS